MERNIFGGDYPYDQYAEGICVNNSGPGSNQIYNNDIKNQKLGVWCQNHNYNPLSGDGLKINCNYFLSDKYHIGVQSSPDNIFATNTGINIIQGFPSTGAPSHVRNKYQSPVVCGNENKYYSYVPYNPPPQVLHAYYGGTLQSIGPQTGAVCSYSSVINNLETPENFSGYFCPDNSYQTTPLIDINSQILAGAGSINGLLVQLDGIDGGDTPTLLAYIDDPMLGEPELMDTLLSKPFLSDTVLKAYFAKSSISEPYAMPVHVANAPVNPAVWNIILQRDFSGTEMDTMIAHQELPRLSERNQLQAELNYHRNERSYAIVHKMMWLLDSAATDEHLRDSLAAMITLRNEGDVEQQLIELDLTFNEYDAALTKLNNYVNATIPETGMYADFMTEYIGMMQDTAGLYSLETNTTLAAYVREVADSVTHPCRLAAQSILHFVFNTAYEIEKLEPYEDAGGGERKMQNEHAAPKRQLENVIKIWPNPASNELLVANETEQEVRLRIFTLTGQLLKEELVSSGNTKTINTAGLINGIYFVNLSDEKGFNRTNKLVIVK